MTGVHFRMGDRRPLLDIISRDEGAWEPKIPTSPHDWDTFCLGFTLHNPVSVSKHQMESHLNFVLGELQQLAESPHDRPVMGFRKMTSDGFEWEHHVALVCYSCAVTTRGLKVSKLWDVDIELLPKLSCDSPAFPVGVTSEELALVIKALRLFFCNESKEPGQVDKLTVTDRGLAGSKRPSHEELKSTKRIKS